MTSLDVIEGSITLIGGENRESSARVPAYSLTTISQITSIPFYNTRMQQTQRSNSKLYCSQTLLYLSVLRGTLSIWLEREQESADRQCSEQGGANEDRR